MEKMPDRMKHFTQALQSLFQKQDYIQSSAQFLQLRNRLRSDAVIFTTKVLPLSDLFVTHMKDIFDNYAVLTYNNWKEQLGDFIGEVEFYEKLCTLMIQLYGDLMTSLKQRQNEAKVNVLGIQKLNKELSEKLEQLKQEIEAKEHYSELHRRKAEKVTFWGNVLAIPTLGISKLATVNKVERNQEKARKAKDDVKEGLKKKVNALRELEITKQAGWITKEELIPHIEDFLEGLVSCATFFANTRAELELVEGYTDVKLRRHYILMKSKAKQIIADCKGWVAAIPQVCKDKIIASKSLNKFTFLFLHHKQYKYIIFEWLAM